MLFKAKVEFDIVIDAEDEFDARDLLDTVIYDELENIMCSKARPVLKPVKIEDDLPFGWESLVPYSNDLDDNRECLDRLKG